MDDAVLDEHFCSDQLIITGIVHHIQQPHFPCHSCTGREKISHDTDHHMTHSLTLGAPGEVASVQLKCSVFGVPSSSPDLLDPLRSKLTHNKHSLTAHRLRSAHLELPLLPERLPLTPVDRLLCQLSRDIYTCTPAQAFDT